MTLHPTPRLLAETALEACIQHGVADPREIEKIARSNAWIFYIDEEETVKALHDLPAFKLWMENRT